MFGATGTAGSARVEELIRVQTFNVQVLARKGGQDEKRSALAIRYLASDDSSFVTGAELVVVPGRHFDPYTGPKHAEYVKPELEWFERHLMGR